MTRPHILLIPSFKKLPQTRREQYYPRWVRAIRVDSKTALRRAGKSSNR